MNTGRALLVMALAACGGDRDPDRNPHACVGPDDLPYEPSAFYTDADGDGYGDASTEVMACEAPTGTVADASDCDDSDASLSPGADDIPRDGIDQDCDGRDRCAEIRWFEGDALVAPSAELSSGEMFCQEYDAVRGDLVISVSQGPDLAAFRCLCEVEGRLRVAFSDVESLRGLGALEHVGGLQLYQNDRLRSLDGLDRLKRIDDDLEVNDNVALASLAGAPALTSIGGELRLVDLPALSQATGFEEVEVTRRLEVTRTGLTSLSGLQAADDTRLLIRWNPALTTLRGITLPATLRFVDVSGNPRLTSVEGLEELETVTDALGFLDNERLESLAGLEGLTSVQNRIVISHNPSLTSLSGLDTLLRTGKLEVRENGLVTSAGATSLASVDELEIVHNAALEEITGFGSLSRAGTLVVRDNASLVRIDGFDSVVAAGRLAVEDNPQLTEITAWSNTTSFSALAVDNNDALETLAGFGAVERISSELSIQGNEVISDVTALHGAELGSVTIRYNPALGDEAAYALVDASPSHGRVIITDNN